MKKSFTKFAALSAVVLMLSASACNGEKHEESTTTTNVNTADSTNAMPADTANNATPADTTHQ